MGQREVGFLRHGPIAYAQLGAARDDARTARASRLWAMLFLRRLLLSRAAVRFARQGKCRNPVLSGYTWGRSPPTTVDVFRK